ncbi:unnamed protein product [Closterium sp. Naga37s-1]|nr:unnamed protein product [Closterium sp. Naga37s-1]
MTRLLLLTHSPYPLPPTPRLRVSPSHLFQSAGILPAGGTCGGRHLVAHPLSGWRVVRHQEPVRLAGRAAAGRHHQASWAQGRFGGILSSNEGANPFFAGWHLTMPVYCDGGGYAGSAGRVAVGEGRFVYMDGSRIVSAIMDDLLANRAIARATEVLVSGTSAGGLAVMRLCDSLAALLPRATVKCLLDGSFFPDAPDRTGRMHFQSLAQQVSALHRFSPQSRCDQVTLPSERWRCFFPQYALLFASSPFFIVNPAFDRVALLIGNQLPNTTNPSPENNVILEESQNSFPSLSSRSLPILLTPYSHAPPHVVPSAGVLPAGGALEGRHTPWVSLLFHFPLLRLTPPPPPRIYPSPPGYYLREAPWKGGTWAQGQFMGILSSNEEANPFFAGWRLAMAVYCDGGGYAGQPGACPWGRGASYTWMGAGSSALSWMQWLALQSHGIPDLVTYLSALAHSDGVTCPCCDLSALLGSSVFPPRASSLPVPTHPSSATSPDLLENRAIARATTVLVSGTSAGGLAVMRLCDSLAALLPRATVKCLLDGSFFPGTRTFSFFPGRWCRPFSFFPDAPDRTGRMHFQSLAQQVSALHQFSPQSRCDQVTPASERWRCFFPQYALPFASSPFFILNTVFDDVSLLIGSCSSMGGPRDE